MISLAKFSIRRPWTALLAWLIAAAVLTAVGFGVSKTLSPSVTIVPNTQSSTANDLANEQFGPSQLVPILLEGPKQQLNRVGPKLVVALTKRPHTRVLSAWDVGAGSAGLRPRANAAMIIASVDRTEKNVIKYDQPQIERLVATKLSGTPIRSYITGQPAVDRALTSSAIDNLRHTELIAVGVLFVLLLIGLRAPVAALVVTGVGALSMLSAFGEVAMLNKVSETEAIGVAGGSMVGLALGVGFALLILDRFHREEFPEGAHPRNVATAALRGLESTGRAVLIGGTGLVIALLLVAVIGPYGLMVSVGTGATVSAMFAIGGAVVVMPAALVLLGRRIDWLSFPAPRPFRQAWSSLLAGGGLVTRHAIFAGFAATVLLAALAIPALGLNQGQPSVAQLPKDSKARIGFEEIARVMGAGWPTQYSMVVVSRDRPITTPKLLAAIDRLQRKIAKDRKTVVSVQGPGMINSQAKQLAAFGPGLHNSVKVSKKSKGDLLKLADGLGQAGSGSQQLRAGLEQAVSGAQQLDGGAGQLHTGSTALHNGLIQLSNGSVQLEDGLTKLLDGANQLKTGLGQALTGSNYLVQALSLAQGPAAQSLPALHSLAGIAASTSNQAAAAASTAQAVPGSITAAIDALSSVPKTDPAVASAVNGAIASLQHAQATAGKASTSIQAAANSASGAKGLGAMIDYQAPGLMAAINMLHDGSSQLSDGMSQLHSGSEQLTSGMAQAASGGGQLRGGLGQATGGAGQLEAGLALLNTGTGQLATGLQPAPAGAGAIANGLGIMQAAVEKARAGVPSTKDLETLFRQSPGMFNSGYFILAAVEGARGSDRNAATFAVNLQKGGTAGQILIVSRYPSNDKRSIALHSRLVKFGQSFAKANHVEVAVGGPGSNYTDWTQQVKDRIPVVIAVLAITLTLILMVALRAVLLPIVAVAFSLLVSAATFGVLDLLFSGSNPPLGGPGYLDPVSTVSIFTPAFAISVFFSTLLLMATRDAYVSGTPNRRAVGSALRLTAAAATGAGIVMVAAMIPFANTELINVRELGVGLGVAILLSVVLLRPVLLPAAEAVLGRAGWWPTRGGPPREKLPGQRRPRWAPRPRTARGAHRPHAAQ